MIEIFLKAKIEVFVEVEVVVKTTFLTYAFEIMYFNPFSSCF